MHVLNALLLGSSLAPLVLMVAALVYASWSRGGEGESEPADASGARGDSP